jgi:hypothetical protein
MGALIALLKIRMFIARSWALSWCLYRLHGIRLIGPPGEYIWYFAYGSNMHDDVFRGWRRMSPLEWRSGHARGYRLRSTSTGGPGASPHRPICMPIRKLRFGAFSGRSRAATSSV